MNKIKKLLMCVLVVASLSLMISGCVACCIILSTPQECPEGYSHAWISCGAHYSFDCYISPEDYNKWLNGETGVITVAPYDVGDDERTINLTTIISIK